YAEYALLGLCLCVIALRVTYTEGPPMKSTTLAVNLGDSVYSLSVSAVLIFSFVLWITWSFCSKGLSYRITGMEIGLGILCAAAVVSVFVAVDKRLAVTDIAVFLAPPLMAVLLVQILDSKQKVKLVLVVIAALGAVTAYQCAEQFFVSNQLTIEQYEQAPETMLEPLGIEPGTFQQFLFEHRLYSRGVRGFFTTRNSAGSFALLALFAAMALFGGRFKNRKSDPSGWLYLFACGAIAAVILLSLVLTKSKGALIGLFFAVAVLVAVLSFSNRLKAHRRAILIASALLCIAGIWSVALYGLKNGRLPGGSSMLVRWQYWHASAKMYADHPLAGVGGGNFGHFYSQYKPAAAPESVADPHNFPLSILTQYGSLGLVGFLLMISVPLWSMTSADPPGASPKTGPSQPTFQRLATPLLIVASAALLLIRPMLMDAAPGGETFDVLVYVIVTVYVAPIAVFFIAFALLAGPLRKQQQAKNEILGTNTAVILACAVLAVSLHNLIDFAIFEPAVSTAFWATIACLVATNFQTNPRPRIFLNPSPFSKALAVAAALAIVAAYLSYALVPVAKATARTLRANQAISMGPFDYAHQLLEEAARDDPLSAAALAFNGRLYLQRVGASGEDDQNLLLRAAACLQGAIERNGSAFKNFERLTEVYVLLAETATGKKKADWLGKALDTASEAVELYPGCGRLHFKLARIAEQVGKTDVALEHYSKAIEIEDAYRDQFRRMYPEREKVVSRLSEESYDGAQQRVEELLREFPPQ
ncbi:MAG: O-antigen ligase family protein, partial [Planctomycetota bacterium]